MGHEAAGNGIARHDHTTPAVTLKAVNFASLNFSAAR